MGSPAACVSPASSVDAELETLWREADLFALATYWEGYGMAIAEALKRGLPVAVTAGGAAASWSPIEAGVVCARRRPRRSSKAHAALDLRPGLRRAMSDVGLASRQRLPSWPAQTDERVRLGVMPAHSGVPA